MRRQIVSGLIAFLVFSALFAALPAISMADDYGRIAGFKFYDCNLNGQFDRRSGCPGGTAEPGIAGWNIFLFLGACDTVAPDAHPIRGMETNARGGYRFSGLAAGTYCVVEESLSGWTSTTPLFGTVVLPSAYAYVNGPNFGNVKVGAGGGHTPGFWSNNNGEAQFNAINGLSVVNPLNLANASGLQTDFGTYPAFRDWLLTGNAVNMAYMLSVHLAAMSLNVVSGFVSGSTQIPAGTPPSGCVIPGLSPSGFIAINDLLTDANDEVGADPYTPAGDPERACQEFKKNALDAANNDTSFTQAPVTSVPMGDLPDLFSVTFDNLVP